MTNTTDLKRIAVFASGSGTNAANLVRFFGDHDLAKVTLILSNKADAFVLKRADDLGVKAMVIDPEIRNSEEKLMGILHENKIDLIVLAGYLLLLPKWLIHHYRERIINIHPSLLPRFGGKGMYGHHVHNAVIASGEIKSGITIHYVNEEYDRGDIIFQAECPVNSDDTPETLAERIHELEYRHYPVVIEQILKA